MSRRSDPSSFQSFLRTAFAGLLVGGIGYAGGWVYTTFSPNVQLKKARQELGQVRNELDSAHQQVQQHQQTILRLGNDLNLSQQQVEHLQTAMRLLKVDQRVAEVTVLQQIEDPQSGDVLTEFAFQEIDSEGNPIDNPRTFRIAGDLLYVDFWVVKFEDKFIEAAAIDKSTSICLFRRLFGEFQEPHEGYTLDTVGERPVAYGSQPLSNFEAAIWDNFWIISNDAEQAAAMGIRAAHGEAVSIKLARGQKYRITLRASDGLSITPLRKLPNHKGVS